ncbi:D-serine deaminase-like pyridoxal phosphate-dependent protein [Agromyces sp. 3263]|uniref:alanine racemase n=1 Tax=Agromyces sp. 3263 TaxID=2817750 RepID=UPI00285A8F01|nr:alanine racemase [Agromyces sp. 3263]MDR6904827.1 D-serine deaminase-like pyridoxal phosphate-dependent protein [Agromyces sp. 3263]
MPRGIDDLGDEVLAASDTGLPLRAAGLTVRDFLATGPTLEEFWTPVTVLDARALRRNADTIQAWATAHGMELMPHGKTTMAPALWRLQLDAGATGLTLATPGQVRTARAFGISAVMLANALVAPDALAFVAGELDDPAFAFACWVDAPDTVQAMERGLAASGISPARPVDVLVELGAPGGRTGARSLDAAEAVARRVAASPVLRLAGVAGYEGSLGHDRSARALRAVRDYLADLVELHRVVQRIVAEGPLIVSAGGSAYLDLVAEAFGPAIEADAAAGRGTRWILRSGASLLHDDGFYHGISPLDEGRAAAGRPTLASAMRGYARVVSHPEPGLALLDGGKRDFPYDEGLPVPFGVAPSLGAEEEPLAGASVTAVNDQHAFLRSDAALPVAVGDVVSLGLSHPCTAFDKRRWLPVVEHAGSTRVVDLVRTFF